MNRDYIDFQDRNNPVGYLITFRCYGTWFHGDEKGSMDRRKYNRFGTPNIPSTPKWQMMEIAKVISEPFDLGAAERSVVDDAIREVCLVRGYLLYGLNVRTNHVHTVVYGTGRPERIMDSFKAYATQRLRSHGLVDPKRKLWSRHGSTKYLWTERHIDLAVDYVMCGQGGELPKFD